MMMAKVIPHPDSPAFQAWIQFLSPSASRSDCLRYSHFETTSRADGDCETCDRSASERRRALAGDVTPLIGLAFLCGIHSQRA